MSKKRICFLAGNSFLAGSEIANINVAKTLSEQGHDVIYLVTPWARDKVGSYIESLNIKTITFRYFSKVYDIKHIIQSFFFGIIDSYNLLRVVKKYNIEVLHLSSEHYARIFLYFIIFNTRIRILYRLGDAPNTHRGFLKFIWKKILIPRVDSFVCVSQYIKGKLKNLECPEEKIKVVYSYPFIRNKGSTAEKVPANFIEGKGLKVIFLGQVSAHKGVSQFVDAAIEICKINKEIRFYLLGSFDVKSDYVRMLKSKIDENVFEKRIVFLGFQSNIHQLLSHSDIHVCPSVFDDPMPNVIFEAKMAGIPSVVFPSGGIPELIDHKKDGYVCINKKASDLVTGISYFMEIENLKNGKLIASRSLERHGVSLKRFVEFWNNEYEQI